MKHVGIVEDTTVFIVNARPLREEAAERTLESKRPGFQFPTNGVTLDGLVTSPSLLFLLCEMTSNRNTALGYCEK